MIGFNRGEKRGETGGAVTPESEGHKLEKSFRRAGNNRSLVFWHFLSAYLYETDGNDRILRGFPPLGFLCG